MTCIIGYVHEGKVWMGGDSLITNGSVQKVLTQRKVFKRGDMLIGVSGPARLIQLVRHELGFQSVSDTSKLETYESVLARFVEPLRELLKERGFLDSEDGKDTTNSSILIGVHGRLFYLDSWLALVEHEDRFQAIGGANEVAIGAFAALDQMQPRERILRALEIAGAYWWGAGPPYYVEVLDE